MAQDIQIKSKLATAVISTLGAEIKSFNDGKKEYIWQADPAVWARSGPVLFPICGMVPNNTYHYEGNSYSLGNHGFSKDSEFDVFEKSENSVTFSLKANETTKKCYPFDFELLVTFTLVEKVLTVTYTAKNLGDSDMYFSFGGHEGYACPEGVEAYTLNFDKDTSLCRHMISDGFLTGETETVSLPNGTMALDYNEFARGTYMFKKLKSSSVTLSNGSDRTVKITFDGFPHLAIWTLPERKYLCIEPWCGFSQAVTDGDDIKTKSSINKLASNESFSRTHTIEIID